MRDLDPLWLVLAGLGGGLTGSIAGLASLVTYPSLLALGLAPVSANVTNSVALVFSSVGSISGSRPELRGQRERVRELAPVVLAGGIAGSALLLATPSQDFARVVPWLIAVASVAMLKRPTPADRPRAERPRWQLLGLVFLVAVYSGYFGAGAGVMMLAILLLATSESLARSNALKNVLMGLSNGIAALAFAVFGPVHWLDVVPLALGAIVGGRIGPPIVRVVPPAALRAVIACAGLGLAVHLGLDAYR